MTISPPANLIDALEQYRRACRWTDEELARELGINRTTWSLMRSGKRQPSRATLAAVVRRFPEFAPLVTLFLQSHVTNSDINVADGDNTESVAD